MSVSQMNGKPIAFGSFTDYGQANRLLLVGRHTTIKAAHNAIARSLEPTMGAFARGASWWIAEISSTEQRREWHPSALARLTIVEGPYTAADRPRRI